MRENCTYSSEGGVTFKPSSLPLSMVRVGEEKLDFEAQLRFAQSD
jgi:hypothetical protein